MAAHHISLAKASFGASLLRPDVTKVSRDDLPYFHNAFEAALTQCSSRNIETCKQWLLENVVLSAARTAALGKYLVTISRHLTGQRDETAQTSLSRRRLHILYLLNDLLHHGKHHDSGFPLRDNLTQPLQPFLVELFQLSTSEAKTRVARRLSDLVRLWKEEEYFGRETITQLLDTLAGSTQDTKPPVGPTPKPEGEVKELPFLIPPTHGDPSLPYYDLPAGNLMRHIIPNSSQPMQPDEIRALQLSAGPADESLVNALKDFLGDVDSIETSLSKLEDVGISPEIDELGQISFHNEAGDLVGDTYYGWSRSFCEKMKKRGRRDFDESSRWLRSRSTDRSRSSTPRKRRRRSSSSRGGSRSSGSNSRSPSRPRYGEHRRHRNRSKGQSRSRSWSDSPPYSHSKAEQHPRIELASMDTSTSMPSVPPPPLPAIGMTFPPPPFAPTGIPLPPPRPPQWVGAWPPPPPPPFPQGNTGYQNVPFPPQPQQPNFPYPSGGWAGYSRTPGQSNHHAERH